MPFSICGDALMPAFLAGPVDPVVPVGAARPVAPSNPIVAVSRPLRAHVHDGVQCLDVMIRPLDATRRPHLEEALVPVCQTLL